MTEPAIAPLDAELQEVQARWLAARREEQDRIYAREFAPLFLPLFAALPLHGWQGERPRCRALISVLGLSWQPVALMAAWLQPERILLVGTRDSLAQAVEGEAVMPLVSRLSGVPLAHCTAREVQEPEELGIYWEIRRFVERHALQAREVFIDPTGGKKSMSASATLAGFLVGAWLVYVDYAHYHPQKRIPVAGTEYPRLLHNPLEVFGDLEMDRLREALKRGNFDEAAHLAGDLARRLYESREAEGLELFARAYGCWHTFRFQEAQEKLSRLKAHLQQFGLGRWPWSSRILPRVAEQAAVTCGLADLTKAVAAGSKPENLQAGLPLVLNHLAAAERALKFHQASPALLLTYASLERYLDLCLFVFYGLDDEQPDYAKVSLNEEAFHAMGRKLHGKAYRKVELGGPINLAVGAQLLATLRPELLPEQSLGPIQGLMTRRNKTEFEHGLCPTAVGEPEVAKFLAAVKEIVSLALAPTGENVDTALDPYRFPEIDG